MLNWIHFQDLTAIEALKDVLLYLKLCLTVKVCEELCKSHTGVRRNIHILWQNKAESSSNSKHIIVHEWEVTARFTNSQSGGWAIDLCPIAALKQPYESHFIRQSITELIHSIHNWSHSKWARVIFDLSGSLADQSINLCDV